MLSNAPLLKVFDHVDPVMLAISSGADAPLAVLEDEVANRLFSQCRAAKSEAQKSDGKAVLELCTALEAVLKSYRKMRDEYYHRLEIEQERDEAEQRLQDVQNDILKSSSTE